jgi:cell division GTPase FtsZ
MYSIDRRGSRVACIQSLAVDVDENTLQQLTAIPDAFKIYFPPFDPGNPDTPHGTSQTATIDIAEIISRVQNFESGENDAIFICCGLGGRMADIVPHVIAGLRASVVEPIFGLVTLPCLTEGVKCSSKAADDIDILSPLLDGMILFDNETWYKKTRAMYTKPMKRDTGIAGMLGFGKKEPELTPIMATYLRLNELIVRRISLILKAGEFRADGGIDNAEVVLDSGEVLNTMKDGGFITIGYAVERLPNNPLAFLSLLKPAALFNEENTKKASRIVELAKQAIYHEVSTPCDMTSAHKALVLIAGPSHELSMQGFMTVRKWIDRSIRGIEMRSGDYPVMNTNNVAIIVMLSGLENIPRVSELREIRDQARLGPVQRSVPDDEPAHDPQSLRDADLIKDEMIILPTAMQKQTRYSSEEAAASLKADSRVPETRDRTGGYQGNPPQYNLSQPDSAPRTQPPYRYAENTPIRRAQITEERTNQPPVQTPRAPVQYHQVASRDPYGQVQKRPTQQPLPREPPQAFDPYTPTRSPPVVKPTESSRQKIEQELQRQRTMALSGAGTRPVSTGVTRDRQTTQSTEYRIQSNEPPQRPLPPTEVVRTQVPVQEEILQTQVQRRVIIRKRAPMPTASEPTTHEPLPQSGMQSDDIDNPSLSPADTPQVPLAEKDVSVQASPFQAKDGVFSGKEVRTLIIPKVKDAASLDSGLNPKKSERHEDGKDIQSAAGKSVGDDPDKATPRKPLKKWDDLSWK